MKQHGTDTNEISMRLLALIAAKGLPQVQQIAVLSRVGLLPKDIAAILGTTPNTVRVALVSIRKAERLGKRFGISKEDNTTHEKE
jgi:DNA-binding CsgD family transcriptional regulator